MSNEILVINEFDEYRADLTRMGELANFVPDTSTTEGYDKSKRLALDIAKVRTGLEKARKEKKDFFWQGGKAVDAQAKEIKEKLVEMETPHLEAYKKIDNYRKEQKQIIDSNIQAIIITPNAARVENWDSKMIQESIDAMLNSTFDYQEQKENALMVRDKCIESLKVILAEVSKAEEDAIQLAKFQAEAEAKAKVEYEEKLKAEARKTAEEAQAKAEAEKVEAEKARKQAVKNAEKAREEKLQAEKQAAADLLKVENDAAKNAVAFAKKAADDANKAFAQAELEKVEAARIAREEEAARHVEEQNKIAAESMKREANVKHNKKINNEVLDSIVALGVSKDLAKLVVIALSKGDIPHTKMSY